MCVCVCVWLRGGGVLSVREDISCVYTISCLVSQDGVRHMIDELLNFSAWLTIPPPSTRRRLTPPPPRRLVQRSIIDNSSYYNQLPSESPPGRFKDWFEVMSHSLCPEKKRVGGNNCGINGKIV